VSILRSSLIGLALTGALAIASFDLNTRANSTGADPGHSGDPADGGEDCTHCHMGNPVNQGNGLKLIIFTDQNGVQKTFYTPGQTYKVRVGITSFGTTKFGFQASTDKGQVAVTSGSTTTKQVLGVGGKRYITHTAAGTVPQFTTPPSTLYEFDWTAPATNQGTMTIYAALCAANGNNANSGDTIYTLTKTITGSGLGLAEIANNQLFIQANDNGVNVRFTAEEPGTVYLTSLSGQRLGNIGGTSFARGDQSLTLPTNGAQGLFLVTVETAKGRTTRKIAVQ